MYLFIKWLLFAFLIMLVSWVIPGITVSSFWASMIVVVVISLINMFIRPLVNFISLPLNILTLGLFSLVINAVLLLLAAKFSPGFQIDGFWSGLFGALLISVLFPLIDKIGSNR